MTFLLVLRRDLAREARTKETLLAGLMLVALFLVLDLFAFADLAGQERAAAAILWSPILFGAAALCGRSLASDADRGTLALLRTTPVPWMWHGLSRTAVNGLLMAILVAAATVGAWGLFAVPVQEPLVVVLALATVGVTVVGTLAGAIAAQARAREALLPILMVPVLAPLVQAGVQATWQALLGATLAEIQVPLLLMASYDLMAAGIAWLVWPHAMEA